jgi:hypothetical protein
MKDQDDPEGSSLKEELKKAMRDNQDNVIPFPKPTRQGAPKTPKINQTAIGNGIIQVGQVHGNLVVKQTTSKARKTKVPLPPDSIGADRHLKQAIQTRVNLIKEEWAKKSDIRTASGIFYRMFKKNFGIPQKDGFGVIWYWGIDRVQVIIDYLDEIYDQTIPGKIKKAARRKGYVHTSGHLYRREGELLHHLGWDRGGPEIKKVLKLLFNVVSHSNLSPLQHADLVDYLEKEVRKWENP